MWLRADKRLRDKALGILRHHAFITLVIFHCVMMPITGRLDNKINLFPIKQWKKYFSIQKMKCPICFESFKSEKKVVSTQCGHLIHNECIQKWLNTGTNTCPKCRTPIPNRNKLVKMYLSSSDEMSETEETQEQGNSLVGIVNWSGAAQSLEYRTAAPYPVRPARPWPYLDFEK